jgi:glucose-6-phosphate isomerase, archaeal
MSGKESFINKYNLETGELAVCVNNKVYLNDMKYLFKDKFESNKRLKENPLIYETFYPDIEENARYVFYGVTKIHPGRIGDEFFMTKGHLHIPAQVTEIYFCLSGEGMLLEQKDDIVRKTIIGKGNIAYIGESSFHRVYNTGKEPLIFFVSCNADFKHDYSPLDNNGFLDTVTINDI